MVWHETDVKTLSVFIWQEMYFFRLEVREQIDEHSTGNVKHYLCHQNQWLLIIYGLTVLAHLPSPESRIVTVPKCSPQLPKYSTTSGLSHMGRLYNWSDINNTLMHYERALRCTHWFLCGTGQPQLITGEIDVFYNLLTCKFFWKGGMITSSSARANSRLHEGA